MHHMMYRGDMSNQNQDHAAARALRAWRRRSDAVTADRDPLVLAALEAGLTKEEVHVITGLGRTTIDRIQARGAP